MKNKLLCLGLLIIMSFIGFRCASGPSQQELELERKALQEAEERKKAEQEMAIKIALSNAMEYYKNQQYNDAIRNFRAVIDSFDQNNEIAYKYIADSYYRAGRKDEAIRAYKEAIEKYPEKAFLYRGLAYLYLQNEMDEEAYSMFAKSVELDTTDNLSYQALSNLCTKQGEIDSALFYAEQAFCYDSTNESLNRTLIRFYERKRDRENLAFALETLLELNPDDNEALLQLGKTYAELEELDTAQTILQKYIDRVPDDPSGHHTLGLTYYYAGNYSNALESLKRANSLNPDDPKILCDMGLVHIELKNYNTALDLANSALSKKDNYGYAYLLTGSIYEGKGFDLVKEDGVLPYEGKLEFEKAVNEYKKALRDPDWSKQAQNKIEYLAEYLPSDEEKKIKQFLEEGRQER